jgi:hypothetical protein
MNALQNVKVVNVTPPAAIVDNASFTTNTIDTAGFGKLAVYFSLGATDIAMTALKLQESDDSGMSGAADITGCVYGATGAPALPTATDDNKVFGFFVNLAGRDRYIDVVATAGDGSAGTFGACTAILYNGDPINDATERGLAANIIKD